MMENTLFSREKVNCGRQFYLDLAKVFAIFFMVLVHVYMVLGHFYSYEDSVVTYKVIGQYLGGILAAPLFMFSMGIGITYSRNSTPLQMTKRAGKLYFKGLLLNLFRFTVPVFIIFLATDYFEGTLFSQIFNLDILQFAALAFIVTALLLKLKLKSWHILLIAIGLNLIQTFLSPIPEINEYADFVIGHFLNTANLGVEVSTNPFLSWYIFVPAGMVFGDLLIRCKDVKKFFIIVLISSFVLATTYIVLTEVIAEGPCSSIEGANLFHQMRIWDALGAICADILLISLCYYIQGIFRGGFKSIVLQISGAINSVYCIHWVILTNCSALILAPIIGDKLFDDWLVVLIAIGLFIIASVIAIYYKKFRKYLKKQKNITKSVN